MNRTAPLPTNLESSFSHFSAPLRNALFPSPFQSISPDSCNGMSGEERAKIPPRDECPKKKIELPTMAPILESITEFHESLLICSSPLGPVVDEAETDIEETDGGVEEGDATRPPSHISLISEILDRCLYFLSTQNLSAQVMRLVPSSQPFDTYSQIMVLGTMSAAFARLSPHRCVQ
jgi:hypothetical protein